jgi:uncharacterized protein
MQIRDAVHGDIELTTIEAAVLDTPEIQRLRAIKQLGTAHLVFPSCTHTRFEHSLGTMAVAKRIMQTLEPNLGHIPSETRTLVSVGALLHDVTHIPFGHTFEDERKIFPRHDKGNRLEHFLLGDGPLGKLLEQLGFAQELNNLLNGKNSDWHSQIISASLDADLLDYLRRDAYMAGLAQSYDDRIFQHFMVVDGQLVLNMVKHNMDRPDVKSEIIHLLRMRYYLTERVYFHHAKVISGAMVSKAVELALQAGLVEDDLLNLGDYTLFESLKTVGNKSNPGITALIQAVEKRQLLKRAYVLTSESIPHATRQELIAEYHQQQAPRTILEKHLAELAGLEDSQIIVYCNSDQTFKEAAIPVLTKDGLRKLNAPVPNPSLEIKHLEEQYEKLWRFYVFAPASHAKKVNQICQGLFSAPSEHF